MLWERVVFNYFGNVEINQLWKALSCYPRYLTVLFCLLAGQISLAHGQSVNYSLYFPNAILTLPANPEFLALEKMGADDKSIEGKVFRLIQFDRIPSEEEKAHLQALGVHLQQYIRNYGWFCSIESGVKGSDLRTFPIRLIADIAPAWKLSKELAAQDYPTYALSGTDRIRLEVHSLQGVSEGKVHSSLLEIGAVEVSSYPAFGIREMEVPINHIPQLAKIPFLYYIAPASPAPTPEVEVDRANHRSNMIATDYLGGLKYDGRGVTAAVSEGMVDTTLIDFHGRIDPSYHSGGGFSGHATGVCQRMAGAGNWNPLDRGMAFGADILTVPGSIWNSPGLYSSDSLRVANHSYGWGCSGGYSGSSIMVDNQIRTQNAMMHVFSAGNIGTDSSCAYYGVPGWANITGHPKMAKNPIATGSVNIYDQIEGFSSRGPAYDGRIKPDICAVGPGGTSHASPGVAGAYTQLMQVYKSMNGGQEPPSGLLKGILQNTAEDLGNPGPDFLYGYGRINVRRAYKVIQQVQHITGNVANGAAQLHSITVPAGVRDLRIMLYWSDREATSGAPIALVNDLDLQVTNPAMTSFAPWVLDHTPNLTSITSPATRGRDSLNNMEQVTISNPMPGNYQVEVAGHLVPMGPQTYYLIYEFLYDELTLTYPGGAEGFVPGETEVIRWDSYGNNGTFDLEFSADNGNNWTTIATGINANLRYYNYVVPDTISGHCRFRVKRGLLSATNAAPFSIIRVPQNLGVTWTCGDSTLFTWDAVPAATGYEVSRLGAKYMDSTSTTTSSHYVFRGLNLSGSEWFSVKALGALDAKGRRAIAYQWTPGDTNCVPANAALTKLLSPAPGYLPDCFGSDKFPVTVVVKNLGTSPLNNIPLYYQVNAGPIYSGLLPGPIASSDQVSFTFPDSVSFPTIGLQAISVWVQYPGDTLTANDSLHLQIQTYASLSITPPYVQNFDLFTNCSTAWGCESITCGMFDGWFNIPNTPATLGDSIDFRTHNGATGTGGTGPSSDHTTGSGKYIYLEGSGNGGSGCLNKLGSLHTPCIDLSNTQQPELSFWYHMYGGGIGKLNVDAFVHGAWDMNIMPEIADNQGNNWFQRSIDLADYEGEKIVLRFRATTGGGFAADLALDDINLNTLPYLAFGADRLNICVGDTVQLTDSSSYTNSRLWSVTGGAFAFVNGTSNTSTNPSIALYDVATYTITLQGTNAYGTDTLVRTNYIQVGNHFVSLVASDTSICAGDVVNLNASFPNAERYIFGQSGTLLQNSPLSSYSSTGFMDGDILTVYAQLYPGCYTDTAQVTMAVAEPILGTVAINSSLCPIISFTGGSNGGDPDSWSWDFGDGLGTSSVQNPTYDFTASGNGTYLVQLITQNECGADTVTEPLTIACLVSSLQPFVGILQVYPNPTSGIVEVNATVRAGETFYLTLTDMQGKTVFSNELVAETDPLNETLDLRGCASGMYYLLIRGTHGEMRAKIMVE